MKPLRAFLVVAVLLAVCSALHADPATRPAFEIPKDETPKQALKRGCKVFDTLDLDAVLKLYSWENEQQHEFVKAYGEYAIALTRVEHAMVKKFSRKDADDLVHAAGEQTEEDVDEAEITIDGDKATVKFKDAEAPIVLQRIEGVWKATTADLLKDMGD